VKLFKYDIETEELVRGSNGLCIECKPGEKGEVLGLINDEPARAFKGYTDSEATQKKITHDVLVKGDTYFRSGDLMYYDVDGFFYFVDRTGDTFRWKGENVATNEVSDVITRVTGIKEANVYGVAVPNHDGRAGMVSIVMKPECELSLEELYQVITKELPLYAAPIFARVQEEMEITSTFKHKKVTLVKEGFNPTLIKDPLYFRDDKQKKFVVLDENLFSEIGNVKL